VSRIKLPPPRKNEIEETKTKTLPALQIENLHDILHDIRYPAAASCGRDKDINDNEEEDDQHYSQASSPLVSSYLTLHSGCDDSSCCKGLVIESDYIVLSGIDDQSFETPGDDEEEEYSDLASSSWSVLSKCESILSVDSTKISGEGLSYCEVAKLGYANASKNMNVMTRTSPFSAVIGQQKETKQQYPTKMNSSSVHCASADDDEDGNILMFLYDGAKSCHGGKTSEKFRGKRPRPRSSQLGWHTHKSWTRKQRKANNNVNHTREECTRTRKKLNDGTLGTHKVTKCGFYP